MLTFQDLIARLSDFWAKQGCVIQQGYDLEIGAGTSNPATFFRALGPEPYNSAYVEPCRRPKDGRYGENPNRLQHYFQFQVIMKPSPANIQQLYLKSLEAIGFQLKEHDIRFVHDDWENPTLGAWGLGWEVWRDGMEVSQFTYFQCVAGIDVKPVTVEITYGLERLAMTLQGVNHWKDLQWNQHLTYGDIYLHNEVEWSRHNFEGASVDMWRRHFEDFEAEAKRLIGLDLPIPAYDFVMKSSHAFNILDARGSISVTERTGYIARIRALARLVADCYLKSREQQNFPLLREKDKAKPMIAASISKPFVFESGKKEDFLLEIGSEELPATFVPVGCAHLEKGLKQLLQKEELSFDKIEIYGTPRRLTALIRGLATGRAPQSSERKGPPVSSAFDAEGKCTKIGEGFLNTIGKPIALLQAIREGKVSGVEIRLLKGSEYLFALLETAGCATGNLLAEHLPALILNVEFPKKMRWAHLDIAYARPLRWICALLGKEVVPFAVGDIVSDRCSSGHSQLRPGFFSLDRAQDYVSELKKHSVMVDIEERKKSILDQLDAIEKQVNGTALAKDKVMAQVLHLVEWPLLTTSTFDASFLKAPKEVLISEMVEHQKYFPLANSDGSLKNSFVITADNTPSDKIREGNTRVISARLADGVFLYALDLKSPLDAFNEKLKSVTFQKGLGSVYDKVLRLDAYVNVLHELLPIGDKTQARRAALLCKADLASEVVGEFPELQGVMGRHYALKQGENDKVAQAIEEHWMPRGENAPLPATGCGTLVSLAEKIDNLLSCFAMGLKPTSSSDPYALRRQVLGIIKMLIQGKHRLPLMQAFGRCYDLFVQHTKVTANKQELLKEIEEFILHRIKTVFQDYNLAKDEIEASLSAGFEDIYDTYCRVTALHSFRVSSPQCPLLLEVYKRAKGQLEGQKMHAFSAVLLKESSEKELNDRLNQVEKSLLEGLKIHDYDGAYKAIATLQPALASLFDNVKILADDEALRHNRIALLQRVFGLFGKLLDFGSLR